MDVEGLVKRHGFLCELRDQRIISDDAKRELTGELLDEYMEGAMKKQEQPKIATEEELRKALHERVPEGPPPGGYYWTHDQLMARLSNGL